MQTTTRTTRWNPTELSLASTAPTPAATINPRKPAISDALRNGLSIWMTPTPSSGSQAMNAAQPPHRAQ